VAIPPKIIEEEAPSAIDRCDHFIKALTKNGMVWTNETDTTATSAKIRTQTTSNGALDFGHPIFSCSHRRNINPELYKSINFD